MTFLTELWHVLLELAPWLLLGTVVAGLLHALLPVGWIRRRLNGGRGVLGAVALGVPLPLCSCGVVPVGLGLRRDGASKGAAVGFLVSTPQTGVDSILVAASFLGWPFALAKVFAAAVTGAVAGWLTDAVSVSDDDASDDAEAVEDGPRTWASAAEHAVEVLRSIWVWIVVGVLASAAITIFVPTGSLEGVRDWGPLASGGLALVLSLPLYVCATASIPIAAALVAGGLPIGAALVFLMAGPATNLGTIGAIHRRLGGRVVAAYLGTIIVGSLAFAVLFDRFLPTTVAAAGGHQHGNRWSVAAAVVLLGVFAVFAIGDLRRLLRHRAGAVPSAADAPAMSVPVEGMTCRGCTSKLESALLRTEGVREATVRLEPGEAVVRGDVDEETVRDVVRGTGFRVPESPATTP